MFAGVGLLSQPQRVSNCSVADAASGLVDTPKQTKAASSAQPKSNRRGLNCFLFMPSSESINARTFYNAHGSPQTSRAEVIAGVVFETVLKSEARRVKRLRASRSSSSRTRS